MLIICVTAIVWKGLAFEKLSIGNTAFCKNICFYVYYNKYCVLQFTP